MKNKTMRILPYTAAQKLSETDLQSISAAGTMLVTNHVTFSSGSGTDFENDIAYDI